MPSTAGKTTMTSEAKILIIKLGALGDVIRTTPLLRVLQGEITWVTSPLAEPLLRNNAHLKHVHVIGDQGLPSVDEPYDLVINLEDGRRDAELASSVASRAIIGPYISGGNIAYDPPAYEWFDMSLSSRFGRTRADQIKMENRRTYQEIIFDALGFQFRGEEPVVNLPLERPVIPRLVGLEQRAGNVWPTKRWTRFEELASWLESLGYRTRFFEQRDSLEEYARDIQECEFVICGDTLAMHLALMLGKKVVTIFTCTSPHEIHGYGRMAKVVSPLLNQYFYQREYSPAPAEAISLDAVAQHFLALVGDAAQPA
jgi:heptosyltransferase II